MVEAPLAFDFNKTRTVCAAFDDAWAFLQGVGSDLTEPSKSPTRSGRRGYWCCECSNDPSGLKRAA